MKYLLNNFKRTLKSKEGWGLGEMIILSAILLLTLLFAAYLIYNLYQSFDIPM